MESPDPALVTSITRSSARDVYAQFIRPATGGDAEAILVLPAVLQHGPYQFVSEIVDIYLANLHIDLLPSDQAIFRRNQGSLLHAKRGLFSLNGLWRYMKCSILWSGSRDKAIIRTIRQRFLPRLPDLIRWFEFFIDNPPTSYLGDCLGQWTWLYPLINATYFYNCVWAFEDLQISEELARHPHSIAFAARLWLIQYRDIPGSSYFLQSPDDYLTLVHWDPLEWGACTVASIMCSCLNDDTSRPILARNWINYCEARFGGDIDPLQALAASFLSRIKQITESNETGRSFLQGSAKTLEQLGTAMNCLLTKDVGRTVAKDLVVPLSVILDQQSFIFHFTQSAYSISKHALSTSPETLVFCINFLRGNPVRWTAHAERNPVPRLCDLIRGRIFETMSNTLMVMSLLSPQVREEYGIDLSEHVNYVRLIVLELYGYTCFHAVAREMIKFTSCLTEEQRRILSLAVGKNGDPDGGLLLDQETERTLRRVQMYSDREKGHIAQGMCANAEHSEPGSNVDRVNYRVCGGCRSLVYCTKFCQVEDWPRHRRECDDERRWRISAKLSGLWYSIPWKSWHMKILWDNYLTDTAHEHVKQDNPQIAHATYFRGRPHWEYKDPFMFTIPQGRIPGFPVHFSTRLFAILGWAKELPARDDPIGQEEGSLPVRRLVIGEFPFGKYFTLIALKVQLQFQAVSSGDRLLVSKSLETLAGIGLLDFEALEAV